MAVEVSDLVDLLQASVNPPGSDIFPDALTSDWENNLRNAFWEAVLDGLIVGYTEEDGSITPITGTTELPKQLQQLVILYAGVTVVRNYLMNLRTVFRSKAGPVEYEVQQSASVLKGLLDELISRRTFLLTALKEQDETNSYYFDSAIARDQSMRWGDTFWINQ